MQILHLTDFHFKSETDLQVRVVNAIMKCINEAKENIDFVLFTGDLVQSGESSDLFEKAKIVLFDKLVNSLNICKENILFCPGNHDVNRKSIHKAVRPYFASEITDNEKLNRFYQQKDEVYQDSLNPMKNYNDFLASYHTSSDNDIQDLYSIHYRRCKTKKIAIVSLNSAWLSSGEDMSNLYIPLSLLSEIFLKLEECDSKILLLHHPLYFLKEFNFYEVEASIHQRFDMMFSGHVHKVQSSMHYQANNGIYDHVAKASLSIDEFLGCSLIKYNEEESSIITKEITYSKENNGCEISKAIVYTLPCGEEKHEQNLFRRKIFENVQIEITNANELILVDISDVNNKNNFLSLFNNPILRTESSSGIESKSNSGMFNFEELYLNTNNYLIFGKDKCGKTSLLKKIQLEYLINFSKKGIIPFYFDCKEYESKIDDKFTINKLVSAYFSLNNSRTEKILSKGTFRLLVDNFNPQSAINKYLNDFFLKYSSVSYVICSDYNVTRLIDLYSFGDTKYEKIYFHDISRKEICSFTEKWISTTSENKEAVQEKIVTLCKQLELPLNYWTISLFLLIYKKSNDDYHRNLFEILDLCVDEILGKKVAILTKSRVGFDQLKRICGDLSVKLFLDFKDSIYSAKSIDVLNIIDQSIKSNNRISADAKEIFDFLLSTGILKLKDDREHYTFRLNGFFEYFLAYHMTKNETFKEKILSDEQVYLAFKNELEIYSGFKRNDLTFLTEIFQKTKKVVTPLFANYASENKDDILKDKLKQPEKITEKIKKISLTKALSGYDKSVLEDSVDVLIINSDVHKKELVDLSKINSDILENYLSVFARVYRNSDEILENDKILNEMFDFLLDSYCNFGFYLIDEFTSFVEDANVEDTNDSPEIELLKLVSNFAPFLSEVSFYDGLGHYNLETVIKSKIEILKENIDTNQLKLFMLYFLLIDIDLKKNKDYINEVMDVIKMPVLKTTIFLKLNFYLTFKTNGNKSTQEYLSSKIQQARLNLDSKYNIGEIQKQIQSKKKKSLISRWF